MKYSLDEIPKYIYGLQKSRKRKGEKRDGRNDESKRVGKTR